MNLSPQDRLYDSIMQQVNTFRELLGMPDNERFNVVLFGGRATYMYVYGMRFLSLNNIIIIYSNAAMVLIK